MDSILSPQGFHVLREDFNPPVQPRLPEEFIKDADSGLNIIVSLLVGQSHLEYERIAQGKGEAQS